jgi:hypothetical protein
MSDAGGPDDPRPPGGAGGPGDGGLKRMWTADEANAALPWVRDLVSQARSRWTDLRARAVRQAKLARQNGHGVLPADMTPIQACVDELAAQSVVLRDVERGLVDFPARAPSGRGYWLCWLPDEDAVTWWHWPEDGFAGRTPLDDPPS